MLQWIRHHRRMRTTNGRWERVWVDIEVEERIWVDIEMETERAPHPGGTGLFSPEGICYHMCIGPLRAALLFVGRYSVAHVGTAA